MLCQKSLKNMAKNYYEILGVSKSATADELKSAYRKLAKKYHPDVYASASDQEKKDAEAKFKEISHAYDVLCDDQKRAAYDTYGDENGPTMGGGSGFGGFGGAGGFGFDVDDIFSSIFSGFGGGSSRTQQANAPRKGQDILMSVTLSFEEAAFGVQKSVNVRRAENCPDCHGTGAKDGKAFKTCSQCGGSGKVSVVQNTPFGQIRSQSVCPTCKGKGRVVTEKCTSCGGQGRFDRNRDVKVNIPAGIDNGQRVRYENEGHAGVNGGEKGALYVEVRVAPHKLFVRAGADVHIEVPISFSDAALGCEIEVPTLYGNKQLSIPAGTQSGTEFTLRGMGIKRIKGSGKGDEIVKVIVEVPRTLNREQKDLLKKFDNLNEKKQYPLKKAYEEKLTK